MLSWTHPALDRPILLVLLSDEPIRQFLCLHTQHAWMPCFYQIWSRLEVGTVGTVCVCMGCNTSSDVGWMMGSTPIQAWMA